MLQKRDKKLLIKSKRILKYIEGLTVAHLSFVDLLIRLVYEV